MVSGKNFILFTLGILISIGISPVAFANVTVTDENAETGLMLLINPVPATEYDDAFSWAITTDNSDNIIIGVHYDSTSDTHAGTVYKFNSTGHHLFTIDNPTPEFYDEFGDFVTTDNSDNIIIGGKNDNTDIFRVGSVYKFNSTGHHLFTIDNPTPESSDYFGNFITTDNSDNIIIGARHDNTSASNAGSVYKFNSTGHHLFTIDNPAPNPNDHFGDFITTDNSDNIIIGAHHDNSGDKPRTGSVYKFNSTGHHLFTIDNPTPNPNDKFGTSITTDNSDNIIIGAHHDNSGDKPRTGSVYKFNSTGHHLFTIDNPAPNPNDRFGTSITTDNSDNIIIGAPGNKAGSVYKFNSTGHYLFTIDNPAPNPSDKFGTSITTDNSDNIIIGEYHEGVRDVPRAGAVYKFNSTGHYLFTVNIHNEIELD